MLRVIRCELGCNLEWIQHFLRMSVKDNFFNSHTEERHEMRELLLELESLINKVSEKVKLELESSASRVVFPGDNFETLRKKAMNKSGVYAIFFDENIVYIGKSRNAGGRFREHFIKCSETTNSKIGEVTSALNDGKKVELSFVELPTSVYSVIEEQLITTSSDLSNKRAS